MGKYVAIELGESACVASVDDVYITSFEMESNAIEGKRHGRI
jgi:hypothetical protein